MKNLTWALILSAAVVSAGCSLKKTAEDTAATTKEMNETTKDMNETTKELAEDTKEVKATSNAMRENLTYKESHDSMMKHMDWLFMETDHASKSVILGLWQLLFGLNEDPDLFLAGAATIYSMHFQFWKGATEDEDLAELDKRLELGSDSLFDRLFKHVPRDGQVDVLRPNASYKGIAALGAKMDLIDERYERGLKHFGLPRLTYYDYVVEALRNRDALERTERFPRAAAKILQWEHEAKYLLQLRHNILPMMVMARLTDFQDRKDLRRFWMWWMGQKVDISKANPEALKEWTIWLKNASQTRKDLRDMGIEPQYNKMMAELVEGVDFGQKEIMATAPRGARAILVREFAAAYLKAVEESKPDLPLRPEEQVQPTIENFGFPL